MDNRVGWVASSDDRGTLNIVWSCFTTLVLCVWTAVHPNIQIQPTLRQTLQARLLMMVTAVIFPEIVISSAWKQLETARWLRKSMQESCHSHTKAGSDQTNIESADQGPLLRGDYSGHEISEGRSHDRSAKSHASLHNEAEITDYVRFKNSISTTAALSYARPLRHGSLSWNNKQTFFAVMGGFVVEMPWINNEKQSIKQRWSLTAKGVEYLSLADATPALTVEDVDERNNSDLFAKTIVIVQLSWFAIQTVARLGAKLPLSALEIHTVVHVICAIIMYAIWKDKPYALERPILLDDSRSQKVAALLICKDRLHEIHREQTLHFERARESYWIDRAVRASRIDKGEVSPDEEVSPPPRLPKPITLAEVLGFYATTDGSTVTSLFENSSNADEKGSDYYDDSVFRSMASDAAAAYATITKSYPAAVRELDDKDWSGIRQTAENFILRQVWGSWSKDTGHNMDMAKFLHFVFNLGYGGLHLAAWNSSVFPTEIERTIWRVSSIIIASVFLWGTAWVGFWKLARSSRSVGKGDWDFIFAPIFGWYMLFFILARCYLLIESLISLRNSPAAMYREVRWTTGFPHAG